MDNPTPHIMLIPTHHDPMGEAIRDYYETGRSRQLTVHSPMFDTDEMPVGLLFRGEAEMNALERHALRLCRGRVLDVGAGAGCHSLALQARGADVTAIDVSPLSVDVMRRRGIARAEQADFFGEVAGAPYDTVLMLMNGIGIVGRRERLPEFFARLDTLLAPGGTVVLDSSDLRYVFEDEDGYFDETETEGYYGEVEYRMQYGRTRGLPFDWLYADERTLAAAAHTAGYEVELLMRGDHYDYLAAVRRRGE